MADPPPSDRLGGMALANGLLVHGPRHWAAAVRDEDGRMVIACGRKRLLRAGRLTELPVARGLVRLGEAFAVLPAVQARAAPGALRARGRRRPRWRRSARRAVAGLARRRLRSVLAQEAVGAVVGLAPALVTLRGSQAAVWHAVEHKSIAAYEAGGADEVANAADHAKEHDRCGSNLVVPCWSRRRSATPSRASSSGGRAHGRARGVAALSIGAAVEVFAFAARRPGAPALAGHPPMGHAMQSGFATREPSTGDLLVGQAAMEALLRAEAADAPG